MQDVNTKAKRQNKRWPEALKREIVAATLASGVSVSVVARQYDVNANQVFSWRRRFREVGKISAPVLLPVTITSEPEDKVAPAESVQADTIEIEIGDNCRARVGSGFDGRALKRVLDVLRKQRSRRACVCGLQSARPTCGAA
ncbi:MAG: transposase [Hyphomicrobiaceae bacterium]